MLLVVVVMYAKGFAAAIGTWAILAQVLFFTLTIVASYALASAFRRAGRACSRSD